MVNRSGLLLVLRDVKGTVTKGNNEGDQLWRNIQWIVMEGDDQRRANEERVEGRRVATRQEKGDERAVPFSDGNVKRIHAI